MRGQGPRLAGIVIVAGAIVVLVWLHLVRPGEGAIVLRCVFHDATGLHCPGCGTQRFLHAFLNGRFLEAVDANPLLAILAVVLTVPTLRLLWALIRENRYREPRLPRWAPPALAVLVIAFFIARNLPFPPFTWLAP